MEMVVLPSRGQAQKPLPRLEGETGNGFIHFSSNCVEVFRVPVYSRAYLVRFIAQFVPFFVVVAQFQHIFIDMVQCESAD